ncbi:MAG TPA: cold shock and DUF1294 domain-containing protein [Burkholderiaceae bacterium]|nr:cold shock and DUF1294 domain-containing protein [Burkholderiaceae bacterium]
MRYQGKITNWKDDQGFGFVTPNGGGLKAFVHIKAFSNRSQRPEDGDIITYELATNENGRFFAKNIRFAVGATTTSKSNASSWLGIYFAILFGLFFILLALLGRLPLEIVGLYFTSSIVTFLAYALDKKAAQNDRWRTKESTLHLFGLIGGWPGALLAQKTLRHKSRKQEFQTIFWVTVIANCITLGWLLITKSGSTFLSSILDQVG